MTGTVLIIQRMVPRLTAAEFSPNASWKSAVGEPFVRSYHKNGTRSQ